jgi:hypothetical protein
VPAQENTANSVQALSVPDSAPESERPWDLLFVRSDGPLALNARIGSSLAESIRYVRRLDSYEGSDSRNVPATTRAGFVVAARMVAEVRAR